jgi:hypothetical protein
MPPKAARRLSTTKPPPSIRKVSVAASAFRRLSGASGATSNSSALASARSFKRQQAADAAAELKKEPSSAMARGRRVSVQRRASIPMPLVEDEELDTSMPFPDDRDGGGDDDFIVYDQPEEAFDIQAYTDADPISVEAAMRDPYDGKQRLFVGHTDAVTAMACDMERGIMFSASWDSTVIVWNLSGGAQLDTLQHSSWVNDIAVLQKPYVRVVTASEDGLFTIWQNFQTVYSTAGEYQVTFQQKLSHGPLTRLAVHADGNMIFSASLDKVFAFHLSSASVVRVYRLPSDVNCIAVQDEYLFCGCDDHRVWCYDIVGGFVVRELKGHTAAVRCIVIAEEHNTFYSAGDDCAIRVWTLSTGICNRTIRGHRKPVRALAVRTGERDRMLYSCSTDGVLRCTRMPSSTWKTATVRQFTAQCLVALNGPLVDSSQPRITGQLLAGDYAGRIYNFSQLIAERQLSAA